VVRFYREAVLRAYPAAHRIDVIQDNWPVHFHPEVQAALRPTPIRLVRLPTYAPWTNPVEKVWRKLYAEVLHLHRFTDAWDELTQTVQAWLDQWTDPAPALLRYVGLLCPS
jgi:transposase